MSARSKKRDEMNLSLTGSQILSNPSRQRPTSAGHLKRPNSTTDLSNKEKTKRDRGGNVSDTDQRSARVTTPLSSHRSNTPSARDSSRKVNSNRDDFLALFESNVQPKIKGKIKESKSNKPTSNAARTMWDETPLKNKFTPTNPNYPSSKNDIPDFQSDDDDDDFLGSHSDRPHNIFHPHTARSSSDEEDNLLNKLSQSIKSPRGKSPRNRNLSGDKNNNLKTKSTHITTQSSTGVNSIANNMTSQGMKQKTRVSLTSIENIKHKLPVNQVKNSTSNQVSLNAAEQYIQTLNQAASKIQLWFRRHRTRRKASEAAMKRMFEHKRKEMQDSRLRESGIISEKEFEENQLLDRKKIREEKQQQARQQAIQELQKKREEKREEVKKKAEEELSYLQATGKITKNPSKTNIGKKSAAKTTPRKSPKISNIESQEETFPKQRSENVLSDKKNINNNSNEAREDDGHESPDESSRTVTASHITTKTSTTINDLFQTLKKLEEEEKFATPRPGNKNAWIDDIINADGEEAYLSADKLEKLNPSRDPMSKSGYLSDDKLKSIMSFLDEVQTVDRLTEIDQDLNKVNDDLDRPALLVPTAEELCNMEEAQAAASEVTNTVLSQRMQLEEKKRTVQMLQKALNQQRELTVRHAKETEKEMQKRLDVQKDESEETIKRHLSFIDQLIDDKKTLSERCEQLVKELKTVDKKYQDKFKSADERHNIEMQKLKDVHAAAEKLRREKWIEDKTKKIKEMTVKGLEPEIQRLIAKHKGEFKKMKQIHEAELLESDERAAQRYVKLTEELRDQLAKEKEAACARERELAKQRYEKQLQQEEESYQQQRRRLYSEIQDEKDRISSQASRQRSELDKLQRQLEDTHRQAISAMKSEFEKAREEQDIRHESETRALKERLAVEQDSWKESYMKKQQTVLMQKERELKDQVKKDRDKEIELVIQRLEEDASESRVDCERTAEHRIKRIRDKYESEMRELEHSERIALERYNEIKARMTEVEGENERLKVFIKQKDQEIADLTKLTDKMHQERDRVSDIIRQEFADRLVMTDEENKRLKNDMSELRARHRVELDKTKESIEEVKRQKEEELAEVHKRVKQAIVKKEETVNQLKEQYQAALKRADHLEGLLQQQRKQLLGKS